MFCAHVHTPLSAGTGSYCYLSSFLAPELLTSSPEGAALHQDYSLRREHVTRVYCSRMKSCHLACLELKITFETSWIYIFKKI
jgi:hypothetical protein